MTISDLQMKRLRVRDNMLKVRSYAYVVELGFEPSLQRAKATPFSLIMPCQEGKVGDAKV